MLSKILQPPRMRWCSKKPGFENLNGKLSRRLGGFPLECLLNTLLIRVFETARRKHTSRQAFLDSQCLRACKRLHLLGFQQHWPLFHTFVFLQIIDPVPIYNSMALTNSDLYILCKIPRSVVCLILTSVNQ